MTVTSLYPVVATADVARLADWYRTVFSLQDAFTSDWYVHLTAGEAGNLAILQAGHETIPAGHRDPAAPRLLNLEVEDVDAVHARLTAAGAPVLLALRDEPFGQRHFITQDPDGNLVDVITPIPPTGEFAARYSDAARPA